MRPPHPLIRPPGWQSHFTRDQAAQAKFKNGTRIEKNLHEVGDGTPLGTKGTVLGSMFLPGPGLGVAYFIEWDNKPRLAVLCREEKLK